MHIALMCFCVEMYTVVACQVCPGMCGHGSNPFKSYKKRKDLPWGGNPFVFGKKKSTLILLKSEFFSFPVYMGFICIITNLLMTVPARARANSKKQTALTEMESSSTPNPVMVTKETNTGTPSSRA